MRHPDLNSIFSPFSSDVGYSCRRFYIRLNSVIYAILRQFLRFLPRACPGCGNSLEAHRGLCAFCQSNLKAQLDDHSPLRAIRLPHLIHLGPFEGPLKRCIYALKYQSSRDIAHALAQPLSDAMPVWWNPSWITSVPLHRRRQNARGYNQSALIGQALSEKTGIPHAHLLKRTRATAQQAKLEGLARLANVENAFECPQKITGNIVLIDDVFTTGSTLLACEEALLNGGATRVYFVTLARVSNDPKSRFKRDDHR